MTISEQKYADVDYLARGYVVNTVSIANEIQKAATSALIDLYEIDLTSIGVPAPNNIIRIHDGTVNNTNIVWQGNTYLPFPIEVSGYELNSKGTLPRPTFKISNIGGVLGALSYQYNELVGAKVTRKRTFSKFLDAVNFPSGNTNADPTAFFDDEVYYIDRKAVENYMYIQYELSTAWDLMGVTIPRRQIIQNVCTWKYRGEGCGYAGTQYFDALDNSVSTLAQDVCGKTFTSCTARFPSLNQDKPFGGFPAVGLIA